MRIDTQLSQWPFTNDCRMAISFFPLPYLISGIRRKTFPIVNIPMAIR
ncbi:hypothetical protein OH687_00820 [Burkholderia anthina]|nr:hypothetical protein OH687_00820 [Burkholderia anthina]